MDAKTLAERKDELQIVDVRYPNEWEAGHIEGAVHIPRDDLADRLDEVDRERTVVTVCRSGSRSGEAAAELAAEGVAAENLEGGMLAWVEAGLPLSTPDGRHGTVAEPEEPPDDRPESHQRLQADFMSLLIEVQEHFGDHEPTEDEVQGYLRERMISDGRTPEEADEAMARITGEDHGGQTD
jgi:rhodanese-related sulfurtransferase